MQNKLREEKPQRIVRLIIKCVIAVCAVCIALLTIQDMNDDEKIPYAPEGGYVIFEEELLGQRSIKKADTDGKLIYFEYGQGVAAAYDYNGEYQFSISTHRSNNGTFELRCSDGLLYLSGKDDYSFIFDGGKFVDKILPADAPPYLWFKKTDSGLTIKNGKVFSAQGEYITEVPGYTNFELIFNIQLLFNS